MIHPDVNRRVAAGRLKERDIDVVQINIGVGLPHITRDSDDGSPDGMFVSVRPISGANAPTDGAPIHTLIWPQPPSQCFADHRDRFRALSISGREATPLFDV